MAYAWSTPREAIKAMCGGIDGGTPPFLAMDITVDENGKLISAIATKWDDWLNLPVRENDAFLTNKNGNFRCPRVVVAPVYEEIPVKAATFSSDAVWRRDGGICQVSKRKLARGEGNMGHIKARHHGGTRTFDNIVLMDKKLNTLQGTRTPEQMGWGKLAPKTPNAVPASFLITEPRFIEQAPFLTR